MYRNLSMEDIEGEIWKPVVGYENDYMVSNYGRVKSIFTTFVDKNGRVVKHTPKILRQSFSPKGYLSVRFSDGPMRVHRVVAYAFLPPREGADQINHKDCNPQNNKVENLEWCTPYENLHHAIDNRRFKNYSYADKEKAIELYKKGYSAKEIGEMLSVNATVIQNIMRNNRILRKDYRRRSKYIDLEFLKSLIASGMKTKDIAREYNVPENLVAKRKYQMKRGLI